MATNIHRISTVLSASVVDLTRQTASLSLNGPAITEEEKLSSRTRRQKRNFIGFSGDGAKAPKD
jgi:hypothetical protein